MQIRHTLCKDCVLQNVCGDVSVPSYIIHRFSGTMRANCNDITLFSLHQRPSVSQLPLFSKYPLESHFHLLSYVVNGKYLTAFNILALISISTYGVALSFCICGSCFLYISFNFNFLHTRPNSVAEFWRFSAEPAIGAAPFANSIRPGDQFLWTW